MKYIRGICVIRGCSLLFAALLLSVPGRGDEPASPPAEATAEGGTDVATQLRLIEYAYQDTVCDVAYLVSCLHDHRVIPDGAAIGDTGRIWIERTAAGNAGEISISQLVTHLLLRYPTKARDVLLPRLRLYAKEAEEAGEGIPWQRERFEKIGPTLKALADLHRSVFEKKGALPDYVTLVMQRKGLDRPGLRVKITVAVGSVDAHVPELAKYIDRESKQISITPSNLLPVAEAIAKTVP